MSEVTLRKKQNQKNEKLKKLHNEGETFKINPMLFDSSSYRQKVYDNIDINRLKAGGVNLSYARSLGIDAETASNILRDYKRDIEIVEVQKKLDEMSFDEAFQHSRKKIKHWGYEGSERDVEPGDTFTWRGKEYKVTTAEEEKYMKGAKEYDSDLYRRRRAIYRQDSGTYPSDYSEDTKYWKETLKGRKFATEEELESDRFIRPRPEDELTDYDIAARKKRLEKTKGKTYR